MVKIRGDIRKFGNDEWQVIGGRHDRKSRFSKKETAFAGVQKVLIVSTQRIMSS